MQPTEADAPDPRRWWTLVVLCLSLLVISLDNTILNVALPTLEADLHATSSQLQWIVDSYMLVFAGLLLTAGALGDRFGRRRALNFGLAIFGLGSALSAVAGSAGMLIASRALMGVGGAFIMPSTLSILTATFPANERAKAIGIWAGVSGLGIAIGPVAGGWIIEHADWSWIFLVNVPFVVCRADRRPQARPGVPRPGGAAARHPRLRALHGRPDRARVGHHRGARRKGWTDPTILAAFGAGAAVLAAFAAWEIAHAPPDARRPLLPQPAVLRRERGDHALVLRDVRRDLLPHPVPAARARHVTAGDRPAHPAGRRRPRDRRAAVGEAHRSGSARSSWSPPGSG